MKKTVRILMSCSMFAMMSVLANAAGTYYTGAAYQAPQSRYGQSASYTNGTTYSRPAGYSTAGYSSVRYNGVNANAAAGRTVQQKSENATTKKPGDVENGFHIDGGISHQNAMWKMEMKESGSMLHYDNVSWNVLDLNGKYVFNMGKTKGAVEAGFKYGMQWGKEATMVDDDITKGGYLQTTWEDSSGNVIGNQIGHALSIGTSDGGNMMGFHAGFGLPGVFQWGNLKVTPSVGFRYLKYKLETKKNYGLSVDTAACFTTPGSDEIQCDPVVVIGYDNGTQQVIWRDDPDAYGAIAGSGAQYVATGDTYYYEQAGVSHSYEVAWSGPYVALDMGYEINTNNSVDARVEIGLPGYSAEGDQPYRFDWQHPKSVKDDAGMFSAFHLGLAANWTTAISNSVSLSVGVTYDYYNVSGADAETYLNPNWYTTLYNRILADWIDAGKTEADMLNPDTGDANAIGIKKIESTCSGWVCKASGEIDSFYRSLGVRVGISARF